jgi:hypothetical protein
VDRHRQHEHRPRWRHGDAASERPGLVVEGGIAFVKNSFVIFSKGECRGRVGRTCSL